MTTEDDGTGDRGEHGVSRRRLEDYLLGLEGLALLREWPFGSDEQATDRAGAIRALLDRRASQPEITEVRLSDLDEGYERWSATYDDGTNALLAVEEPAVLAAVSHVEPTLALDLASGTGRLAAMLADLGHRVVALDRSAAMLSRAHGRSPRSILLQADLLRPPLRHGSFGLVTCGLALTHLTGLREPVAATARLLRTGGSLIISDMHPLAVATGGHAFFRDVDGSRAVVRNHVHWTSAYVDAAKASGLTIDGCVEVAVDERFVSALKHPEVRAVAERVLGGLPLLWVWSFRK